MSNIQVFLLEKYGVEITVITSDPTPEEQVALARAREIAAERKHSTIKATLIAEGLPVVSPQVTSAVWTYALLEERVMRVGGAFRIELIRAQRADLNLIRDSIMTSSLTFSEGTKTTILWVLDGKKQPVTWTQFPVFMGLRITDGPKLAKRLKEVVRNTMYYSFPETVRVHHYEIPAALEIAFDGMSVISETFAIQMCAAIPHARTRRRAIRSIQRRKTVRGSGRIGLLLQGWLKGDFIISPDALLQAKYGYTPDVIVASISGVAINITKELAPTEFNIATFNPHHAHHQFHTNDQMLASLAKGGEENWLFPIEDLERAQAHMVDDAAKDLADSGKISYLDIARFGHATPETQLDAVLKNTKTRWSLAGRNIKESAFFINMEAGGFSNKLWANLKSNRPRVAIPVGWGAYMHVATRGLVEMAGWDLTDEGYDLTKDAFYHPNTHSFVLSNEKFIEYYERHGTWDNDDLLGVKPCNVVREDGSGIEIMGAGVRMPCGWGEYSLTTLDMKNFPSYARWDEMTTIHEVNRPEYLEEMEVVTTGLTKSKRTFDGPFDQIKALEQHTMAVANPGVGSFVNLLIAYYATFGTYPRYMLANVSDMVDACQQSPDLKQFEEIEEFTESLLKKIIFNRRAPIDHHIHETRLGGKELPLKARTFTGYFTKLMEIQRKWAYNWGDIARSISINDRVVIQDLVDEKLPANIIVLNEGTEVEFPLSSWVDQFLGVPPTAGNWKNTKGIWPTKNGEYRFATTDVERRTMSGELNDNMLAYFENQPTINGVHQGHLMVVAIYQRIQEKKYGHTYDKVLFQTPLDPNGGRSTMDFFLEALAVRGLCDLNAIDALEDEVYGWDLQADPE